MVQKEVEMSIEKKSKVPWYLWPVWLPLKIAFFIIGLVGRLLGLIIAVLMILLGSVLTETIIGAIIGIPLMIIGIALGISCIFKW